MIGKKSMPEVSENKDFGLENYTQLKQAVFSTLAFFALYELPVTSSRVHELLFDYVASLEEVQNVLNSLAADNKIYKAGNLYSIKPWRASDWRDRQIEISKKLHKIDRFNNWLAVLPYVRLIAVINSLAMGTADADSDIDFFVVTKNKRLYFVRSIIIVIFRILGVYKTREKIKDKFCFGFFVTADNLNLQSILLKPADPYLLVWLSSMRPLTSEKYYLELMAANNWLKVYLPNFDSSARLTSLKKPNTFVRTIKVILEVLLWIPSAILEPVLRRIHIDHTFKLPENHAATSTTIANAKMLKLHAHDVRNQIAQAHKDLLNSLG
jgi:hypothetical protein